MSPAKPATVLVASLLLVMIGCGASEPSALPDDASFRACLRAAKVDPDKLSSAAERRRAFGAGAPWECVLRLRSAEDRHRVVGGVFPNNGIAQVAPLTAWIDTQSGRDAKAIADDAGTLLEATNDPLSDDAYKAMDQGQNRDIAENQVALAIYLHVDGTPADYAAYVAARTDDPAARSRYFQHTLDIGGPIADRLRTYADIIHKTGVDLRRG